MAINLILYYIVCYSIGFLFIYSTGPFRIFEKIRIYTEKISPMFGELFSCMYCFPTWIGICMSLFNTFVLTSVAITPFHLLWFGQGLHWVWILLFDMVATSGGVYLLHTFQEMMERIGS